MADIVFQVFALVLLGAAIVFGYLRWIRSRAGLSFQAAGLLTLIVLTLAGGFLGAFFWWADEARSFSWDLPPLASRMLASAAWSFAGASLLGLERPTWSRLRLIVLMLAVYLTPLVVAIFLFHLDRFDFSQPVVYGFFVIAGGMTLATLWYLFRPPDVLGDRFEKRQPPQPLVVGWLGVVALVCALWGVALFVTDGGPSALIWVWPGDLLTSRLIGVMLLTVAVGAVYALRDGEAALVMLVVTLIYGLGLAVASLWNALADLPIKPAYLVVFGVIFLGSALLLALRRG